MDKNIVIIFVCGLIIFVVLKYLDKYSTLNESKRSNKHDKLIDIELFNSEKNNIELSSNSTFDPYTFYTKLNKPNIPNIPNNKYNKDNFDFDYETNFKYTEHFSDDNIETQSVDKLSSLKKTSVYLQSEPINEIDESPNWITYDNNNNNNNFLVPNELESNSIYSMPFPENTSIELASFTAENVTDLYDADNMENLYNTINADMYRGYKTLKYML